MAVTTTRLHIFCMAASRQLVNDTLRYLDPTSDGTDPIAGPLRLMSDPAAESSNGTVFGGSWAMSDTTRQAFNAAVRDAGWTPRPSGAERTVYGPADNPPQAGSGQRMWMFDGLLISYPAAMAKIGVTYAYSAV